MLSIRFLPVKSRVCAADYAMTVEGDGHAKADRRNVPAERGPSYALRGRDLERRHFCILSSAHAIIHAFFQFPPLVGFFPPTTVLCHHFSISSTVIVPLTSRRSLPACNTCAMYAARAASRAAPAVFRAGIRTSARTHRPLNRNFPAVSILIPLRALQTESTSSSTPNYPPPGFDAEKASKPLPKQEQQPQQAPKKDSIASGKDTIIPKTGATAHPKTVAQDARTLKEMAKDKADAETSAEKKALSKKEEEKVKLTIGQKIKKELLHYWDGTKLLVTEVRISSKLAFKMAAGYELTRRERRQVRSDHAVTCSKNANEVTVATYSPRSRATHSFPSIRHCSFCRIAAPCSVEAFPQHAA